MGAAASEGRGPKVWKVPAAIDEMVGKSGQRKRQQRPQAQRHEQQNVQKQNQKQAPTANVVSVKHALEFEREGHTMLRNLVSGDTLARLTEAVQSEYDHRATEAYNNKLRELGVRSGARSRAASKAALAQACQKRGLPVPTLQVYNIHRADRPSSKVIRDFVTSAEMGRVAADLMGVDSVMLYQTAAFFKRAGEGETVWHSDLNTAPFDTNHMITFWIALTDVPTYQHSPLEFASRSHRDFALAYWFTIEGMKNLDTRGYTVAKFAPLSAGDATAHDGWLIHAAPPNESKHHRKALTVSFVEAHARRLGVEGTRFEPNDVDRKGYKPVANDALVGNTHETWIPEITPGQPVRHKLLPIVYTRPGAKKPA